MVLLVVLWCVTSQQFDVFSLNNYDMYDYPNIPNSGKNVFHTEWRIQTSWLAGDSVQFVFSPTIQRYACDLNEMMLIDTINVILIGDYKWVFKREWFSVSVC